MAARPFADIALTGRYSRTASKSRRPRGWLCQKVHIVPSPDGERYTARCVSWRRGLEFSDGGCQGFPLGRHDIEPIMSDSAADDSFGLAVRTDPSRRGVSREVVPLPNVSPRDAFGS